MHAKEHLRDRPWVPRIRSTFSTVRLQTKVTRGAGSPAVALAMVFKLVESSGRCCQWSSVASVARLATRPPGCGEGRSRERAARSVWR
ncbi:hypothetical protein DMH25_34560 [Streptomyces sp. WAC 01325]|nr:hypothetical protein DMH25_34560 [Streptomyces sp. WAC 01325]